MIKTIHIGVINNDYPDQHGGRSASPIRIIEHIESHAINGSDAFVIHLFEEDGSKRFISELSNKIIGNLTYTPDIYLVPRCKLPFEISTQIANINAILAP